jgi:hypothetical protein
LGARTSGKLEGTEIVKKKRDDGKHIDVKRMRRGYSQNNDWKPKVGHAFREQIKGKVEFPPQRKADIFK